MGLIQQQAVIRLVLSKSEVNSESPPPRESHCVHNVPIERQINSMSDTDWLIEYCSRPTNDTANDQCTQKVTWQRAQRGKHPENVHQHIWLATVKGNFGWAKMFGFRCGLATSSTGSLRERSTTSRERAWRRRQNRPVGQQADSRCNLSTGATGISWFIIHSLAMQQAA